MPKQPESTSALAKSDNPMLDMIRTMAIVDPHHMMEVMQKLIPFATAIPGLDAARLTEIQEKNFFAITNASANLQKMMNDTAAAEYQMLQNCVSETLQQISSAGTQTDTAQKQMEMVTRLFEKISKDTIELMEINSKQLSAIVKDMTKRYIAALNEIQQMSQHSST